MKKIIVYCLLILVVAIGLIYVFIPNIISFNKTIYVRASRDGLTRKLLNEKEWTRWWPKTITSDQEQHYTNTAYHVDAKTISGLAISISKNDVDANSSLTIIPRNLDTTQLIWVATIPTSYNPIKRLQIYFESRQIAGDIDIVLKKLRDWYEKPQNVYGINIQIKAVIDPLLMSTYAVLKNYPTVDQYYQLIDDVENYITQQGAKATGFPMLNVSTSDSINYLTRVAVPVNSKLPSTTAIALKQMPEGGNIIIVDVKGGNASVNNALHEVENYITDYHQSAPAIPFFSLVTDRRKEPDTAKWITRIYYPIM